MSFLCKAKDVMYKEMRVLCKGMSEGLPTPKGESRRLESSPNSSGTAYGISSLMSEKVDPWLEPSGKMRNRWEHDN